MQKIVFSAIAILFAGCSNNSTAKWDAPTASKTCFDAATKGKYDLTQPQINRIKGICDCVGQKMTATYKSEKEANEKMLDATGIANDCKTEWENKEIQNFGK